MHVDSEVLLCLRWFTSKKVCIGFQPENVRFVRMLKINCKEHHRTTIPRVPRRKQWQVCRVAMPWKRHSLLYMIISHNLYNLYQIYCYLHLLRVTHICSVLQFIMFYYLCITTHIGPMFLNTFFLLDSFLTSLVDVSTSTLQNTSTKWVILNLG